MSEPTYRRLKLVDISLDQLLWLLKPGDPQQAAKFIGFPIPADARIAGAEIDHATQELVLTLESDYFPERKEGDILQRGSVRVVPGAPPVKSILQDWVQALGLRHQGVLLAAVRGCDNAPKDDPSKLFVRCYRAVVLNAHCGDAKKAATFIEYVDLGELERRFTAFRKSLDHYPHHYVMHLVHACQIVGYKHPPGSVRTRWRSFYFTLCSGLHLNPESELALDERLNADEQTFAAQQQGGAGLAQGAPGCVYSEDRGTFLPAQPGPDACMCEPQGEASKMMPGGMASMGAPSGGQVPAGDWAGRVLAECSGALRFQASVLDSLRRNGGPR